ncbi:cobaltochelatase subunit CobN, partial [Bradyrhizobium sp. BRP14]|nr:cobaltochelatase subunit CobN [Bradyrhizobium sp. BRP14]
LTEGGAENAGLFLDYAEALIDGGEKPQPARPLLKAGIWWPGRAEGGNAAPAEQRESGPTIAICFYRALVQSGETKPVEALI